MWEDVEGYPLRLRGKRATARKIIKNVPHFSHQGYFAGKFLGQSGMSFDKNLSQFVWDIPTIRGKTYNT